jgi:hypothetical protein
MAGRMRSGIHLPFFIPNQKKNPFYDNRYNHCIDTLTEFP